MPGNKGPPVVNTPLIFHQARRPCDGGDGEVLEKRVCCPRSAQGRPVLEVSSGGVVAWGLIRKSVCACVSADEDAISSLQDSEHKQQKHVAQVA